MHLTGHIHKMDIKFHDESHADYALVLDHQRYPLNSHIGDHITITFQAKIHCVACGRETNKSFNQGFCYPCFKTLARNDRCIMTPKDCHYHVGTCREPSWGEKHCMQPHLVYLAWSSNIKVGITKPSQIPTRWLDQGATQGVVLAEVASRYHAGLIEAHLSNYYSDRTNWRKMLAGYTESIDLLGEAKVAIGMIQDYVDEQQLIDAITYPKLALNTLSYPVDEIGPIKTISLEKESVSGHLLGMKGQYLLLDTGVINLRKYTGYLVEVAIKPFSLD